VPTRPASYCRISLDRLGDELGVQRQTRENAERAKREGWPTPQLFVDNDISAYSGKPRPEYRRLIASIKNGDVDGLVAWHVDRLYRRPVELEELIDILDERPHFPLITVTAGDLDLSTAAGRMMARTVVVMARYESEHKAERLRSKHRELAMAGRQAGGGTRPFGYKADRRTVEPTEARLIREAAQAALAGASIRSICADWTSRSIQTVTGAPWNPHVLRTLLTSARIAGLREHHGEVVAEAEWEAIIDRATHEKLRAVLLDPKRLANRRPAKRYLLTGGLARCSLCGAGLVARPKQDGRRCYVCARGPGFVGCGKIRALADSLEGFVVDAVLTALDTPHLSKFLKRSQPGEEKELTVEIRNVERQLNELAELWASAKISRAEWLSARSGLEKRLDVARATLSRSVAVEATKPFIGRRGALRASWDGLLLDRRRAIVEAVVDRVVVGPAVRGRNFFDPKRVDIVWRL